MQSAFAFALSLIAVYLLWDELLFPFYWTASVFPWAWFYWLGLLGVIIWVVLATVAIINSKTITETCAFIAIFLVKAYGSRLSSYLGHYLPRLESGVNSLNERGLQIRMFCALSLTFLSTLYLPFPATFASTLRIVSLGILFFLIAIASLSLGFTANLTVIGSKEKLKFKQIVTRNRVTKKFKFEVKVKWKDISFAGTATRLTVWRSTKKISPNPESALLIFSNKKERRKNFQRKEYKFLHNEKISEYTIEPDSTGVYVFRLEVILPELELPIIRTEIFPLPITLPAILMGCEGARVARVSKFVIPAMAERVRNAFTLLARYCYENKSTEDQIFGLKYKYLAHICSWNVSKKEQYSSLKVLFKLVHCKPLFKDLSRNKDIERALKETFRALKETFQKYQVNPTQSEEDIKILNYLIMIISEFVNKGDPECVKSWVEKFAIEDLLPLVQSKQVFLLLVKIAKDHSELLEPSRIESIYSSITVYAGLYPPLGALLTENSNLIAKLDQRIFEGKRSEAPRPPASEENIPSIPSRPQADADGQLGAASDQKIAPEAQCNVAPENGADSSAAEAKS